MFIQNIMTYPYLDKQPEPQESTQTNKLAKIVEIEGKGQQMEQLD